MADSDAADATTTPTLQGARVTLRPLSRDDVDAYFAYLQDEAGARLTGTHRSFSRDDALSWLSDIDAQPGRLDLGVSVAGTLAHELAHELLGEAVLMDIDVVNRSAFFRVGLIASATNQGIGREALTLLFDYAFDVLELHRIALEVFEFNPRAVHLYESLGFRHEGVLRDALWWDGEFHDAFAMSLLAPEYVASRLSRDC